MKNLNDRIVEIKKARIKFGAKQIWVNVQCLDAARAAKWAYEQKGVKITIPELLQIAMEDYIIDNKLMETSND